MIVWGIILVIVTGALLPLQAGINSQLARWMPHPIWAGWISFLGGLMAMTLGVAVFKRLPLSAVEWSTIPWYLFCGGFLGACLVFVSIIMAPKLGATLLVASLVFGQLCISLVFDHYGWLGFKVHPINMWRIIGVFLLLSGLVLIKVK
jgi:transporter family-2 protein